MRVHVHEIHIYDQDPVKVDRYSETGLGVQYQVDDDERGPVTVMVPWSQVVRIRSWRYDTDDAVAEAEVGAGDEAAETPANDGEDGDGNDANQGQGDGKAKEWPEASNADMRTWAQSQGLAVSSSGPVSKDVATKFAAAHAG